MNPVCLQNSFYSSAELKQLGLKSFGQNVSVSRYARLYKPESIVIGNHVRIDDFCILSGGKGIELGDYIHISAYCALHGAEGIVMHDFSGLSARVTLYTASDDFSGNSLLFPMIPEKYKPHMRKGAIVIEKHCIIGVNSTVMPNITIAEGGAVGAHSYITSSTEPWSIYAGCPARKIKARNRHMLELEHMLMTDNKLAS